MTYRKETDAETRTVTVKLTRAAVVNGNLEKAGAIVPLTELEAINLLDRGHCTLADETDDFFIARTPPTVEVQAAERRVLNAARDEGVAIQRENMAREHARGVAAAESDDYHLAGVSKLAAADTHDQEETSEATTEDLEDEVGDDGLDDTGAADDAEEVDLDGLTKAQLVDLAEQLGLSVSGMNKDEVRSAIEAAQAE